MGKKYEYNWIFFRRNVNPNHAQREELLMELLQKHPCYVTNGRFMKNMTPGKVLPFIIKYFFCMFYLINNNAIIKSGRAKN